MHERQKHRLISIRPRVQWNPTYVSCTLSEYYIATSTYNFFSIYSPLLFYVLSNATLVTQLLRTRYAPKEFSKKTGLVSVDEIYFQEKSPTKPQPEV